MVKTVSVADGSTRANDSGIGGFSRRKRRIFLLITALQLLKIFYADF